MSHFVVMVIGDNVEAQLQPYHEFECTGIDDQYVVDVDLTEEVRAEMSTGVDIRDAVDNIIGGVDFYDLDEEIDVDGAAKWGYVLVDENGELVKAINRTNPNRKWDWWVEGGRWKDHWKKSNGAPITSGRWADFDIARTRDVIKKDLERKASLWKAICDEHGRPLPYSSFEDSEGVVSEAQRKKYNAQPAIRAKWNNSELAFEGEEDLEDPEYPTKAAREGSRPFAIVKDGVWYGKGNMGWFGVSYGNNENWTEQAEAILAGISPDEVVTVIDCHI